ncbi:MAG: 2-acyl-glycerophospho-ethanolamine acyltransferase, partial [Verrucomicrobiales bacterium]|nr:2-acyl-glycerophospho-ethanolamine acyltransferase [Verrucomicrobiales bacterium]
MARQSDKLELHGEENIPDDGVLVITNRLSFEDLLHLEKLLEGRQLVYLIERGLDYDPLLQAHLDKDDVAALEFSSDEASRDIFKKELHQCLSDGSIVVFIPGLSHVRAAQVVAVPSNILQFLTSASAPVLPLFVDHPEDSALGVEERQSVERIILSFGDLLQREAANLANFTENLLIAAEKAFSGRPLLKSHLAYEILKGLKKNGTTSKYLDGFDGQELRFDKLLAASIVLSKLVKKETSKKRVGIILPPGKGGIVANVAVLLAGKIPVNLNFTAGDKAVESSIRQADLDKFITADPFVRKMSSFNWPPTRDLILLDRVLPGLKPKIVLWLGLSKIFSPAILASLLGVP